MSVHATLRCDLCGAPFVVEYGDDRLASIETVRRWARGSGWTHHRPWSWRRMRHLDVDLCGRWHSAGWQYRRHEAQR